ncbi:MAG: lysophospholipid acyltransferase family protein [Pseudomonadota bacterium]
MRPRFLRLEYLKPVHWPIWLLIAVQRGLVFLPWALQRYIGRSIGLIALLCARKRRRIALDNLRIAYPALPDRDLYQLRRQHFQNLGIGIMEIGMAWWASDRRIARLCDVDGMQHLPAADNPQPVFLAAGHFTSIDMVARGLRLYADFDVLHRPLGIPLLDAFTEYGRRRCATTLIDKRSPRALLASLRRNRAVWIAVDQADTTSAGIEAPFFGQPAATNTTVPRLADKLSAAVLPLSCIRTASGRYQIKIHAPLETLGRTLAQDTKTLNQMVESHIALAPAQYYWIHRRFKRRLAPA